MFGKLIMNMTSGIKCVVCIALQDSLDSGNPKLCMARNQRYSVGYAFCREIRYYPYTVVYVWLRSLDPIIK